ncbi:MAG: hypothetical protein II971_05940, partial [Firmicutes bacterium]|nr:hypothetical protein [Bacillota bacterium]
TGSQAAPRGEIAQLIYNCLTKQIGTVGADGMWHGAMIADDSWAADKVDTMLNRLGAVEREDYELVTEDVIEAALVDLTPYHGAVVKLYENEDGDAIALAEIKTTFVSGKLSSGKLDGYKIVDDAKTGEPGDLVSDAITITNGAEADADEFDLTQDGTYAVTFKGGKINAVYSFQSWAIDKIIKVSADDVKDIAEDEPTVAGYSFPLDDDDELDTSKFVLNGANAIGDIEKNDVLYIYANPDTGDISRIDVGTESVKAEFTKIRGRAADEDEDRYVVGGKTYTGASEAKGADYTSTLKDDNLGNEYTIYLGYDGKLCYAEGEDDTTTDYVVFLKYWEPGRGDAENRKNTGKAGLSVFGADGREELYFKKNYMTDEDDLEVEVGQLVKLTKNAKGDVTAMDVVAEAETSDVTKKGRVVESEAALNASSVIYNFKGDTEKLEDLEDDSKYSVVSTGTLYGKDDVEFVQLHKTSKGYVAAALMTGATGKLDDIVILTAKLHTVKDAEEADVFMDGEKKTITADRSVFDQYPSEGNKWKGPETEDELMGVIYRLTEVDSDGVITEAETVEADDIKLASDAGLRVENDVIFDAGDAPYEIEDGAVFYMFDISEHKWSIVSKNALSGLKLGEKNNQGICVKAIKTSEKHDGYDIFVVLRN